jgi:hypothetical protein
MSDVLIKINATLNIAPRYIAVGKDYIDDIDR